MKVLVYGGGAVGLGIASSLLKAGTETDIIAREETVSALSKSGLKRTGIFGDYWTDNFSCYSSLSGCGDNKYSHILVCTKSFDSETAAQDISKTKKILAEDSVIVLFQNGWGNAEIFAGYFPQTMVFSARVITGFMRNNLNEVKITVHADSIHIGSLFHTDLKPLKTLTDRIAEGGVPCELTQSVEKDLWAKMLYNCALNPLGAILKVPYGKLAEKKETIEIMENIIREIYSVMNKADYSTHWNEPDDYINAFYTKMLPPTALHESSMLQDLRAGKKTEIDALCGAVINLSEEYKLSVPYNRFLYLLIKAMEY